MANKPTTPTSGPSMGSYTFGWDGTDWQVLALDVDGKLIVGTSALPTGAATEAAQTDGTGRVGNAPRVVRVPVQKLLDDATAITVDTGVPNGDFGLIAVRLLQSIGTSTTSQWSIGEVAGFAAGDINTVDSASAATAKGTLVNDNFVQPIPCRADASGYLYLLSGRDANDTSTIDAVISLARYSS